MNLLPFSPAVIKPRLLVGWGSVFAHITREDLEEKSISQDSRSDLCPGGLYPIVYLPRLLEYSGKRGKL